MSRQVPSLPPARWARRMGLAALGAASLLGLHIAAGLSAGFTAPVVAAAASSPIGHPNRADPRAGITSAVRSAPKTAAPKPKPAPLLAQTTQPPSVPMAPGSLALTPTGGTFVGSDGMFEVDVPAGAVTSADLTAAGGSMSLLVRQVLPASGGSAGGSGIVAYGLYLIQVLDASGKLTSQSLHSPLTVKLHMAVLDPTRTLLVLNQALPPWFDTTPSAVPVTSTSATRTQAPARTTSPKPLQPALGKHTSVRTTQTLCQYTGRPNQLEDEPANVTFSALERTCPIMVSMSASGREPRAAEAALDPERRRELATFLRVLRARLRPRDVGLPSRPGQRRTPGLRREELAEMAGIGLTWYTWLEQGRRIPVSSRVVDALARALRLDSDQVRYLRTLADLPVPAPEPPSDGVLPRLQRLVDAQAPAPAAVYDVHYDYLAWNEPYVRVRHDPGTVAADRRNWLWLLFTDVEVRARMRRWEPAARAVLSQFRIEAGQRASDPRFQELAAALMEASPEFRTWWAEYPTRRFRPATICVHHPIVGPIELELFQLNPVEHPDLRLVVQVPAGERDQRRVRALLT